MCVFHAVCVGFLERLYKSLVASYKDLSTALVEDELMKACAEATGKENRLVWHMHLHTVQTHVYWGFLVYYPAENSLFLTVSLISQCYYLGASSDAAAKVTGEVSRPLSNHVPVHKICQRLQQRDQQICDLRYGTTSSCFIPWSHKMCKKWVH